MSAAPRHGRADRGPRRGRGRRPVLPLPPLPRRRGRHPHAANREPATRSSLAPLIVREIDGTDERDATSPYGYPGLARSSTGSRLRVSARVARAECRRDAWPLDPAAIDFSATGLVSVFIRHPLGPPPLTGATERNVVQIADPALPPKSRPSDRRQVRRNLEAGYELELVPGAETTPDQRAGFLDVYEQTMRRDRRRRALLLRPPPTSTASSKPIAPGWPSPPPPTASLAAASIAAVSDGYLHYYLSGSADSHLRDSPMKNVVARLVEHADRARPPAQPRRRHRPRRRPRGVQARLRQPPADLAHLGARLRPETQPTRASAPAAMPAASSRAYRALNVSC